MALWLVKFKTGDIFNIMELFVAMTALNMNIVANGGFKMFHKSRQFSFEVIGRYGMFADPLYRVGGEKTSYSVPTYEAAKGMVEAIYWKPTFIVIVDRVRVMNRIGMESTGILVPKYNKSGVSDVSVYTYLKDCDYQVDFHFEWNMNCPELEEDRNWTKHHKIYERSIRHGGRRTPVLGTTECFAYVKPCRFGDGKGYYDGDGIRKLGFMYHGMTYPNEATNASDMGSLTKNFWYAEMNDGVIDFPRPEECPRRIRVSSMRKMNFVRGVNMDFECGLSEAEEREVLSWA